MNRDLRRTASEIHLSLMIARCSRCGELGIQSDYGLCPKCDQLIDLEYALLYQEPIESVVSQ